MCMWRLYKWSRICYVRFLLLKDLNLEAGVYMELLLKMDDELVKGRLVVECVTEIFKLMNGESGK